MTWTRTLAGAAVLLLSGAARAETTLVTPTFHATAGQDAVCGILNAGRKVVTVTIAQVHQSGTVLEGVGPVEVAPQSYQAMSRAGDGQRVFCRFTGRFSRKTVRAAGELNDGNSSVLVIPAE